MIDPNKKAGPIEQALAQSDDPKLQRLCKMSNAELLACMDELAEMGSGMDEEMYDAAQQLLDERAPIEMPRAEEIIQSWEKFKAGHMETFDTQHPDRVKSVRRTYTPRRYIAVAALIGALMVGITAGAWAASTTLFADLGEAVVRNIRYGGSGQMENTDPTQTGYSSLAEAIEQTSDSDDIECVTWIPSDLALSQVTATLDESGQYHYSAYYETHDRGLVVQISRAYGMPITMEKDADTTIETMRWHGCDYLIVSNSGYVDCEWDKAGYSYSVTGNMTIDELKSVVKSFQ